MISGDIELLLELMSVPRGNEMSEINLSVTQWPSL